MTRWLHLARSVPDAWVDGLIRRQAAAGAPPTVVLLDPAPGDAWTAPPGVLVCVCVDPGRVGVPPGEPVDEAGIVALLEAHDRAAVW